MLLNLGESKRLRLGERSVAWASSANLRLDLLILCSEFLDLLDDGGSLRFGVLAAEQFSLSRGFGTELPLQDSLAFQQCRINALPNIGASFRELFKQNARPGMFISLHGKRVEALTWFGLMKMHQ